MTNETTEAEKAKQKAENEIKQFVIDFMHTAVDTFITPQLKSIDINGTYSNVLISKLNEVASNFVDTEGYSKIPGELVEPTSEITELTEEVANV